MLGLHAVSKVWLCCEPVDLRKSFNGLTALVKVQLQANPSSGQGFVFINRRKTQLKLLYFDGSGYCIWMKRLEQGQFHGVRGNTGKSLISTTELQMIIAGIAIDNLRRYKRFSREFPAPPEYHAAA